MKRNELQVGDIVICDYSWLGRPMVYYVVLGQVMVSFKGDVNCGNRPAGWCEINDDQLPFETVKVYRPKWFGDTFNGDFENESLYECIYSKE
jgi:hypothetical protein